MHDSNTHNVDVDGQLQTPRKSAPSKLGICILPRRDGPFEPCLAHELVETAIRGLAEFDPEGCEIQTELGCNTAVLIWLSSISAGDMSGCLAEQLDSLADTDTGGEGLEGDTRSRSLPQPIQESLKEKGRERRARGIRLIQLPMTGVDDYLPLIRSTRSETVWCCAKGCYSDLVAEHVVALSLALCRGLSRRPPPTHENGDSLLAKHILTVGSGAIFRSLSHLLSAFPGVIMGEPVDSSLSLSRSDSSSTDQVAQRLAKADIVVICCALTAQTRNMVNAPFLAAMKPHARLVNVARADIVDTDELVRALTSGRLAGAALDVFHPPKHASEQTWQELIEQGKLILTPHSAIPAGYIPERLVQRVLHNVRQVIGSSSDMSDSRTDPRFEGVVDAEKGY